MSEPQRGLRVALVSREVYPFGGGGIGEYINACARLLARTGEVTIFTSSAHTAKYWEMRATGDPRVPADVEVVFVPEPAEGDVGGYFSLLHLYSSRILESLRDHYGDRGPDLVEFSDYLGEGAVTVQARRSGDPFLRGSVTAIRLHTSAEVCAVLDGHVDDSFTSRMTCELERLALRDADYLLWPGGDTLSFYHRFYGAANVAPGWRILNPVIHGDELPPERSVDASDTLRLLYLGRLERRKGVQTLVRAVGCIDSENLQLDILGGDTNTAPLGTSMGEQLHLLAAGDPRIQFLAPVLRTDLPRVIRSNDCVVLPSLWEAWPYVGLEALRLNRPIVATPVGGFTEIVKPGKSGWLASGTALTSLVDLLERLVFARDEVDHLRLEELPVDAFEELTSKETIAEGYRSLLAGRGRWTASGVAAHRQPPYSEVTRRAPAAATAIAAEPPLVSIVIPYYRLAKYIADAVRSALEQTHPRIEVIIVNDGSSRDADWILAEIAARHPVAVFTQVNSGLGAARNFGISQARGRFIVPLDADNLLEPQFVERALWAIEADPQAAYVTAWSRYIAENGEPLAAPNLGYQPIGNASREVLRNNVAGDAVALLRRWLFDAGFAYSEDLTSYEDWQFYQRLHVAGHFGVVIPARLVRYRLREQSMIREIGFPQKSRLSGELTSHIREQEIQWMSSRD